MDEIREIITTIERLDENLIKSGENEIALLSEIAELLRQTHAGMSAAIGGIVG